MTETNATTPSQSREEQKPQKKKRRFLFRMFLICVCAGLCLLLLTAAINAYMMLSTRDRILTVQEAAQLEADCVLVLGAGLRRDDRPSMMLADRLSVAIDVYNRGGFDRMLMTGDHGREEYDEVNAMKTYAMERGIPSSHIFMDHAGFSTYESMYRASDIFEVKKVIVVTQHYHLYRALYNAERMGIEAYGVPSDVRHYARQRYFDVREYLARVKDFVWGIFQPAPTYLGAPIPITGNGDVTNDR